MWNWLNCYLSGRHDFGVSCAPGTIFLKCIHCGKRSNGWALKGQEELAVVKAQVPLPFTARAARRLHSA